MLTGAGFSEVRTESATYEIPFADSEEWRRWSVADAPWAGCGGGRPRPRCTPRSMRRATAYPRREPRAPDGRMALEVSARYTFGVS